MKNPFETVQRSPDADVSGNEKEKLPKLEAYLLKDKLALHWFTDAAIPSQHFSVFQNAGYSGENIQEFEDDFDTLLTNKMASGEIDDVAFRVGQKHLRDFTLTLGAYKEKGQVDKLANFNSYSQAGVTTFEKESKKIKVSLEELSSLDPYFGEGEADLGNALYRAVSGLDKELTEKFEISEKGNSFINLLDYLASVSNAGSQLERNIRADKTIRNFIAKGYLQLGTGGKLYSHMEMKKE